MGDDMRIPSPGSAASPSAPACSAWATAAAANADRMRAPTPAWKAATAPAIRHDAHKLAEEVVLYNKAEWGRQGGVGGGVSSPSILHTATIY